MKTQPEAIWVGRAKGLLKAELKRRSLTYRDLAARLSPSGEASEMEERNLRNKVARGTFTAAFLLECLAAIGCRNVRIDDVVDAH